MIVPNSVTLAVTTTNTSPGNNIIAANSALNRFIRAIYCTNTTGAGITLSVGVGAAAVVSASNGDVAFGVTIPANASSYPVAQYGGKGRRALGAGSLNAIFAFAGGAGLILTVIYDDDLLT